MLRREPHRIHGFPEDPVGSGSRLVRTHDSPVATTTVTESRAQTMRLQHRLRLERATERRRLKRELHDELGQHLTALQLTLAPLLNDAPPGKLHDLSALVEKTVASLRRVVSDQRPALLEGQGPTAALRALGRDATRGLGISVTMRVYGREPAVPDALALALYRITQEGLTNVARHAPAAAVRMRLRWEPTHVTFVLEDDGVGLPADALARRGCFGLRGMCERVAALGGTLDFSRRSGGGTRVCARLPLHAARPAPEQEPS